MNNQPNTDHPHNCCRRDFLRGALGCGAYTILALAATEATTRKAFAQQTTGEIAAQTKFASVEKVADRAWAVISTPTAGDFTTLSNGGIIAGDNGVLVIEGFQTPKGASWLSGVAKDLTGRAPTHVALTHFHGDHCAGIKGYFSGDDGPTVVTTAGTRSRLDADGGQPSSIEPSGLALVDSEIGKPDAILPDSHGQAELDLGGRTVRLNARVGHTASDMTIEIDDPKITFCGDLFFNAIFPNYMDAKPSALTTTCKSLFATSDTTFIPGHGSVASHQDIANYLALLNHVEESARNAQDAGTPPAESAGAFKVPDSLGNWFVFAPNFYQNAFEAWHRELSA